MFAFGEPVDGATAVSIGLANALVPAEDLRATAHEAALKLAKRPAGSLLQTKALMRNAEAIGAQMDRESTLLKERLKSAEAREAFAAFSERRQPDFTKIVG